MRSQSKSSGPSYPLLGFSRLTWTILAAGSVVSAVGFGLAYVKRGDSKDLLIALASLAVGTVFCALIDAARALVNIERNTRRDVDHAAR